MTYQEIDIHQRYDKELFSSLCVPSFAHAYSVCVQYMREWFLEKFPKNYFKTVHIDGKHVLSDFKTMSYNQQIKRLKPSLAILPQVDWTYDREKIEFYPYGLNTMVRRSRFEDAFFKDKKTHSYMKMNMELDLMNFNFRVRLSTRAQQLDMYKFMKMAFRVGASESEYRDMDFHVPYDLMIQVAHDNGFEIEVEQDWDEKKGEYVHIHKGVKDPVSFLRYMNSHSTLPFLYKLRCINGHDEYFIRLNELHIHKRDIEISVDDGDTEGMIRNNFIIDLQCAVRFPAPMYYVYYSENKHTEFEFLQPVENAVPVYTVKIMEVPEVNEYGWDQYLTTEYDEKNRKEPLVIELEDLFRGDLGKVIDYNKSIHLSPEMFMQIKLYNGGGEVEYTMDWDTITLTTKECMTDTVSYISVYADLNYLNEYAKKFNKMNEDRLS